MGLYDLHKSANQCTPLWSPRASTLLNIVSGQCTHMYQMPRHAPTLHASVTVQLSAVSRTRARCYGHRYVRTTFLTDRTCHPAVGAVGSSHSQFVSTVPQSHECLPNLPISRIIFPSRTRVCECGAVRVAPHPGCPSAGCRSDAPTGPPRPKHVLPLLESGCENGCRGMEREEGAQSRFWPSLGRTRVYPSQWHIHEVSLFLISSSGKGRTTKALCTRNRLLL